MRRRNALVLALVVTSFAACAGRDASSPRATGREDPITTDGEIRGLVSPPTVIGLEISFSDASEGEDGFGQVIPATRAVALDVRADSWPGRALDPVLMVGQELRFSHYTHPAPGVLRFIAADVASLPPGASVHVQWGDVESSRLEVTDTLEAPQ